jgi:hypothetical protein
LIVGAAEHPAKLELGEQRVGALEGRDGLVDAVGITLFAGELIEIAAVVEDLLRAVDLADQLLEGGLLAQELLRAIVVVPEAGIGRGLVVLLELLDLGFVVKDTSAARRGGPRGERRDP